MQRLVPQTVINYMRFDRDDGGNLVSIYGNPESLTVYGRIRETKARKILDEKVGKDSYILSGIQTSSEMRYMREEDFLKYSTTEKI